MSARMKACYNAMSFLLKDLPLEAAPIVTHFLLFSKLIIDRSP